MHATEVILKINNGQKELDKELSMEICACAFGLDHPVTLHDVSFVPQTGRACGCKLQKCYQSIMGNSC